MSSSGSEVEPWPQGNNLAHFKRHKTLLEEGKFEIIKNIVK